MKHFFLVAISILALFTSCNKDGNCIAAEYDTQFTIETGNSYCFSDGVELKVNDLTNGFCPCDVICVWEGEMVVDMEWTLSNGETVAYTYHSSANFENEMLPDGMTVIHNEDDIVFEVLCSESDPSPSITSTTIRVTK